jgi:phospholipid-binding lipoprotein MlaA
VNSRLGLVPVGLVALSMLLAARPAAADPDRFNQANLRFNQGFLEHVFEPVARGYNFVTPKWGQRRVDSFMHNLEGPRDILNSLGQGKLKRAGIHTGRLLVNTTVGLAGLFDIAGSQLHWQASPETFDETLGVWRVPAGSYLILPVVGEFCTRSLIGWIGDGFLNPLSYVPAPPATATVGAYLLNGVNLLAQSMPEPGAPAGAWEAYRQTRYEFRPYDQGRELFFKDEAERVSE